MIPKKSQGIFEVYSNIFVVDTYLNGSAAVNLTHLHLIQIWMKSVHMIVLTLHDAAVWFYHLFSLIPSII